MKRLAFHEAAGLLGIGDLHPAGPTATEFLLHQLDNARPRLVLEIGAGIGRTTQRMLRRGWRVVPIEPNPILRRELHSRLGIDVYGSNLDDFPEGERFDAVIGESVFYGMNLATAFAKVHRLLRPGGLLASVDMVWTERAEPAAVARTYDQTLATFGLPMASRQRLIWSDWRGLLDQAGFAEVVARQAGASGWRHSHPSLLSALRHPAAFAQFLKYRRFTRISRVSPECLETWMSVWRRV
jgi:SAM-dependent methyltransferase